MDIRKQTLYRQLMWDYNISPQEIEKLINGETQFAGHYDKKGLFIKVLENYPWYIVLQIFDIKTIKELLTDDTIEKLRMEDMKNKYRYVKKRLQEII